MAWFAWSSSSFSMVYVTIKNNAALRLYLLFTLSVTVHCLQFKLPLLSSSLRDSSGGWVEAQLSGSDVWSLGEADALVPPGWLPWCPGALVPCCPPSWHRHVSTGRAGRSRSRSTILGRPRSNSGAWEACDATVSPTKSTCSFSIFALLLLGLGRKWTQDTFPDNHYVW